MKYDVEWIPFGDEVRLEEQTLDMQVMYDTSSGKDMMHNTPKARDNPVDNYKL